MARVAAKPSSPARPTRAKPVKITGLSLRQLLKATPPYIHANAREVIIRELKPATSRGGFPGIKSKILSVGNRGQKHQYRAIIVGKELDIPLSRQKHVHVSCECDFFLYYCEFALTHWGSSAIKYSNGEPAVQTNPGNLPLLCIAKDQRVHAKRGLVPIQDIVVGDVVQSHKGWTTVLAAQRTGERKTLELSTQFGRNVQCTPDHRVLSVRNGRFGWHKAESLSIGDWIVSRSEISFEHRKGSKSDYARLFGYFTAEGSGDTFSQPAEFENVRDDFFSTCKKLGYEAKEIEDVTNRGIAIPKELLQSFLDNGFVQDPYSRIVPAYLFQASYEEVIEFLRGLYAGNGYITNRVSTLGSISKALLRGVQQLLTGLGIYTGLYLNKNSGANHIDMWLLRTTSTHATNLLIDLLNPIRRHQIGRSSALTSQYMPFDKLVHRHTKDLRMLAVTKGSRFNGRSRLRAFLETINQKGLCGRSKRFLKLVMTPSIGFEQIVSVKAAARSEVYDLTTESHSFVVDGLVVHNCKHLTQLAKTVLEHKM